VEVAVSGPSQSCSQKNHNLLYCCDRLIDDVDVLAFADSDIRARSDWLGRIVHPLRKQSNGAASGYRWFIPESNNLPNLALSALNAKVTQMLGNTHFNQAWGGSMAIRTDVFRQVRLDEVWRKALSDDLSLSRAVKKSGRKVAFVPAAIVASPAATNWGRLFEFCRRQLLITRICAPGTWWFGLLSAAFSALGLWGTAAAAVGIALATGRTCTFATAVPALFLAGQVARAVLRQSMITRVLSEDRRRLKAAAMADILGCWAWSLLLLALIISSAFGRTVSWRGIRYRLLGPTETVVLGRND
jgi:cellulose synthase/poly-beta-1,6-N-acetylglucosamine synthase-like glycosyltransferase